MSSTYTVRDPWGHLHGYGASLAGASLATAREGHLLLPFLEVGTGVTRLVGGPFSSFGETFLWIGAAAQGWSETIGEWTGADGQVSTLDSIQGNSRVASGHSNW